MTFEIRRAARTSWLLLLAGCATASAASAGGPDTLAAGAADAAAGIRPEVVSAHIRFLADDLLEGRAPGERGFDVAAAYVASQLQGMGLEPAGDNGGGAPWGPPPPRRGPPPPPPGGKPGGGPPAPRPGRGSRPP